ncbi:GntR family transcriptional regulator [Sphaerisporangium melleum]|uniref:GntR family transcriptional regulator n=1 Tax=Sphaerisporangium melleum TaxID=321316 RepID=A0A917VPP9_9ACTN|nr:FadR/GntR family transcriptional regulator [Sphaerisporangium melleum]GGL02203.1 GntR family transcriptional regulator [Sphaerisporangium melleum]GII72221.1 GntR family transcriptional regulator [Sphaerisporangium melleum]
MGAKDQTKPGLHGTLLDGLGLRIASGELPAGHTLRIEQLEEHFGVSRSVVREAIRVLESMGLLTSRRRVGVTVTPRDRWNLFDPRVIRWRLQAGDREDQLRSLGQLRRGVEPVAAALAARNATPEQCGLLTGAVMSMAVHGRAGDLAAYLQADIAFHTTLLQASGNEMLAALAGVVTEVLAGRTRHHLMPAHPEPAAIRRHAEVAQAVQAGDPEAAERAMRDIVDEATTAMLAPPPTP